MNTLHEGLSRILGHRGRQPQAPMLGERELDVMKILWLEDALSAKQVLQYLPDSDLSLSTMQSTLERLHRKALLIREKAGRFYVYRASVSRSELITLLLGDIAEQISDGQMAPMISGFMAFVGGEGSDAVPAELQETLEERPTDNNE